MRPRTLSLLATVLVPLCGFAREPLRCDLVFAQRTPRRVSYEMPISFAPGGNLFLLTKNDRAVNLTRLSAGDVASPCVSYDAKQILFAMRKDATDTWSIYRLTLDDRKIRRLTDATHNDISPCALPDGGLLFCSDRAGYLDEYGRGPAMLLHRMDADDSRVQQISFNMSHDFDPVVARNGAVLFGRWLNMPGAHLFPLFSANPDGRGLFSFYIDRSDFGHRIARPAPMPDGRILAVAVRRGDPSGAGALTVIDPRSAIQPGQPIAERTDLPSGEFCFRSASILPSGRLLVSRAKAASPHRDFGIWILDADGSKEQLICDHPQFWDEGAVAIVPREPPVDQQCHDAEPGASAQVGVLDVYSNTGVRASLRCKRATINQRDSVKQLRAVEGLAAALLPGESLHAIRARILGMDRWRVLGQAPVAPDGSVFVDIPSEKPVRFQTLAASQRVQTEEMNWFYGLPGEQRLCRGCHPSTNDTPLNRLPKAMTRAPMRLRPTGKGVTPGVPQAIAETNPNDCTECHGGVDMKRWERNAHATSHRNARFLNFYEGTDTAGRCGVGPGYKLDFPETDGVCAACHAPNAALADAWGTSPADIENAETAGVHCVLCHRTAKVDLVDLGARPGIIGMELRQPGKTKTFFMGPYDDVHAARDIYMPAHARSEFCAPCHEAKFWGTPAYATYSEYLATPEAKSGVRCQDCHMPSDAFTPELAEPSERQGPLPSIAPVHVNRAHEDELLRRAAELSVEAERRADDIRVCVSVTNRMGGHHLPTGHPMRNIVMRVEATAEGKPLTQLSGLRIPEWGGEGDPADGNLAGLPGTIFAKILCDELENYPAPSWRRTTIFSDNRIPAHETHTSRYVFALPPDRGAAVTIRVRLIYRRFFKPFITLKGWELPDQLIAEREIVSVP